MAVDTDLEWLFKHGYSDKQIADMAMREHPLYARTRKEEGFVGTDFRYALDGSHPQGIGSTVAFAQANLSDSYGLQPIATRRKMYGVIQLDGETMMASKSDKGAFAAMVTRENDRIIREFGEDAAFGLYRDGTGMRARVVSEASEVLTLTVADDARNFKRGMVLQADNAAAGTSPNAGTTFVTAVNLTAGTVTVEDASDASIIANDYLFRNGSNGSGSTPSYMEGLAVCTPLTAPVLGSDSFRSIDRGSMPEIFAGSRLDDTNSHIEYNIGRLAVRISALGGKVTECYLNPLNVFAIATRQSAKVMYEDGGKATYGFQYIVVDTPNGSIRVWSDPDCPTNRGYLCNPESHYIKSLGSYPHAIRDDGNGSIRLATDDKTEWRIRGMGNYFQSETRNFGVLSI